MGDEKEKKESVDYTEFKTLPEIPMLSITDIKEAPMTGFIEAEDRGTGVYITNRGKVVGVMLTQEQYESLVTELRDLREQTKYIID